MKKMFYGIVLFAVIVLIFGCAKEQPVAPVQPSAPVVAAASCIDGLQNQDETAVDCGGSCDKCVNGKSCSVNGDCISANCNNNACAVKAPVEVPPVVTPPPKTEVVSYSISDDQITQLKAKLTPSTKAVFLSNSYPTGLSAGESYVFPYGIANTFLLSYPFKVEVQFQSAKDPSNNVIEKADEKTILGWFSNNKFENHVLGKYGQAFIPVGVTVGKEMAPGVKTVPGNYNFALVSWYDDYGFTEYDRREFAVRVK
jgi:hypothetical protein